MMTRTQQELLGLLKRVAAFLDENGITFYLFGGTAIGALRHRGFIPWDDDIDILMDRDNYYRLMEVSSSLPDDIEYNCFELDHNFAKPYGMFCNRTDTATSRSRMYWGGICMGTARDVFLTDEVPEARRDEDGKDLFRYQETMADAWLYKTDIAKYSDEYFELMKRRQQIGKPALMEELKGRLDRYTYEESDRRVVRVSGGSPVRKYMKEWIGEPVYCDFEGLRMPLQTMPEACLRMQYGYNWYMIPEPDDQTHHVQIQNYDVSYNNYYKDLSRFIDWDEANEVNRKQKLADIGRLDSWLAVEDFSTEMKANAVLMCADLEEKEGGILAAFEQGNYGEVLDCLSELTANVRLFIKTGCGKGEISPDILSVWIESLIRSGRYWDARKVRMAFCGGYFGDAALGYALDLLDKVLLMAEHWQDHKPEDCRDALMLLPEEIRDQIPDCIVAEAWLMEQGKVAADGERLLAACSSYLKLFPDNYDIMKVKADLLIAGGETEAGEELYRRVQDCSRNGLDLLYIGDYFSGKMGNSIL